MKKVISTMFALVFTLALAISVNAASLSANIKNITKTEGTRQVTSITQTNHQSTTQSTAESKEALTSSTAELPQNANDKSVTTATENRNLEQKSRIANTGDIGLAVTTAITVAAAAAFIMTKQS